MKIIVKIDMLDKNPVKVWSVPGVLAAPILAILRADRYAAPDMACGYLEDFYIPEDKEANPQPAIEWREFESEANSMHDERLEHTDSLQIYVLDLETIFEDEIFKAVAHAHKYVNLPYMVKQAFDLEERDESKR